MTTSKFSPTRRSLIAAAGAGGLMTASGLFSSAAYAKNTPLKIGVLAPRTGPGASIGEIGVRGVQWGVDRINRDGGIGGRQVELVIREETTPRETMDRFRRLITQDGVDTVHGVLTTGVSLALAPAVEANRVVTVLWDGTTQDGVVEKVPNPRYLFKSAGNEIDAIATTLMAIEKWGDQINKVAGVNVDYTYGRTTWTAFQALLEKYGIANEVVAEQWVKIGTMDLTSNVSALNRADPDVVFTSMYFADLPILLQQASNVGLFDKTKFALPVGGAQQQLLKKSFVPEDLILGHGTFYWDYKDGNALQKEFVAWHFDKFNEPPHLEAERAYTALAFYKAGVEKALKMTGGRWPTSEEVADAIPGSEIETLGGMANMRQDNIPNQTFYCGMTTHDNDYDFVTLDEVRTYRAEDLQLPAGAEFWDWIKDADFKV